MWCECWPFCFTKAFIPTFFSPFWIVCVEIGWFTTSLRYLVTWTAFSALPELTRWITWQMLVLDSFVGQPPEDIWRLEKKIGENSGDGSIQKTSLRWYLVTREAKIKERADMVLQFRCQWFHGDMVLFNKLLWFVCYCSQYRGIICTNYSKVVIVWKSANVGF